MLLKDILVSHEVLPHREHQLVGVGQLTADVDLERTATWNNIIYRREIPNVFALFDEVGAGKTKQVIDSSQILYMRRTLDTMVVVAPGSARSTWADEDPVLGEVAKHAWPIVPNVVHEYHGSYTELDLSSVALHWIVTNYEFIRRDNRLDDLIRQLKGRRTWLILDESWAVKGNSDQMRACRRLRRKRADRVTILNGTPLADGKPGDLYYQFEILDPEIIGCKNRTHFKSKHCIVGGYGNSIVGYQNLEELNARIAPYVLSRRTRDCFDLPPMLPPLTVEFKLNDPTWKLYREMRDDMVAWLGVQASISKQAITKAMRLAQITSGFLGGLEDVVEAAPLTEPTKVPIPQWLRKVNGLPDEDPTIHSQAPAPGSQAISGPLFGGPLGPGGPTRVGKLPAITKEIGREKLDAFLFWLDTFQVQPHKLLVWCRFRPELERTTRELLSRYPLVLNLKGGQSPEEREAAKMLLAPGGNPSRGAVVGTQKAGSASLNFAAAPIAVYLSNSPFLLERTQSWGRTERPGATQPMLQVDFCATGPKGQKTIDHHTLKALRGKDDMARWTVAEWRRILIEE